MSYLRHYCCLYECLYGVFLRPLNIASPILVFVKTVVRITVRNLNVCCTFTINASASKHLNLRVIYSVTDIIKLNIIIFIHKLKQK